MIGQLKERIPKCRESFKDHVATVVTDTDAVTVIRWRNKNGSSNYAVQYILERSDFGCHLYVSGDLGAAVFEMWGWRTEDMTIAEWARTNVEGCFSYIMGKMECSTDKYDYDTEDAEAELLEYLIPDEDDYDEEEIANAKEAISDAMDDFSYDKGFGQDAYDRLCELDPDCWEWLGHCGRSWATRCVLLIVGLQMACEMLKKEKS